jgi:hypothetical protein
VHRAEPHLAPAALAGARADADKAFTLDPKRALPQVIAAEAELAIAQHTHERVTIDLGLTYADKALAIDSRLNRAMTVRAALVALR